jgi:hypothetical protein
MSDNMNKKLHSYITAYQNVSDILENVSHYRLMAQHFPLTVSLNASGHSDPRTLATDLVRLWDMLTGKDALSGKYIPPDIFLYFLRSLNGVGLADNVGLRIVGLEKYPSIEVTDWSTLETIISYLLMLENFEDNHVLGKIGMADHFSNIARHSTASHIWILGQGDYVSPAGAHSVVQLLQAVRVPDVISLGVVHSLQNHPENSVSYDALHIRYTEAISSSIYRREYLSHIPVRSNIWWPHLESAVQEVRQNSCAPQHLVLGRNTGNLNQNFVYVSPSPNWSKTQNVFDAVVAERYQIALDSLAHPSDRLVWFYSLDDFRYAIEMCRTGTMPSSVLESFWRALANAQLQPVQLRQNKPVVVAIHGDLTQQILSAASYFKLRSDCINVSADFSKLNRSADKLGAMGLDRTAFEEATTPTIDAVRLFEDSTLDQDLKFGLHALGDKKVAKKFTFTGDPHLNASFFGCFGSTTPYACISLPPGVEVEDANLLLGETMEKMRGLADFAIVLGQGANAEQNIPWLASYFSTVVGSDNLSPEQGLLLMQKAHILACSDSWSDITAAALNPKAVTFLYQRPGSRPMDMTLKSLVHSFSLLVVKAN